MATYAAYRHVELDNVGYGKKRVLKPPGGGSSDIFGAGNEGGGGGGGGSPRRSKQQHHQQSQLSSGFFGDSQQPSQQQQHHPQTNGTGGGGGSGGGSAPETPRSKPGNDSYKRLFGPPDAQPPSTPYSKSHMMRSSIMNLNEHEAGGALLEPASPARTISSGASECSLAASSLGNGHHLMMPLANGNGYQHNDVVAFRRIKRFRGSSCMPRNPVTGDGVDVKLPGSRRIVRRCKDGNPVTGAGYDSLLSSPSQQQHNHHHQNGNSGPLSGGASSAGSDKSSTDSSPSVNSGAPRMKNRVPPGGFSSGLW